MEQWYALHTKPNNEYQVAGLLQELGIQTYLPEIEHFQIPPVCKSKPLFPNYLFARVNLKTTAFLQLQTTPGLRGIVSFNNQPASIPDGIIDLVKQRLGDTDHITEGITTISFKPGDIVRITDGPFKDMEAVFDGQVVSSERVQVLLALLGLARVQVSTAHLQRVKPNGEDAAKRRRRTRGGGRHINYSDSPGLTA